MRASTLVLELVLKVLPSPKFHSQFVMFPEEASANIADCDA